MTILKFADTHNMVMFFAKPTESEGFEQIVDFLNAHTIKYALTINPTIYTSCIEQFWATVKAKTVNGEVQLQALVDGKKIIITESIVKRDLQLDDAESVDCLPNATIFKQLTLMGSKTTAWNEFSSTMASAIICLATNKKFNFSKYIFESMVKNLDGVGNFLMYPRFVQVFLDKQVAGMSSHTRIYVTPSHTKKIFGNIRRVGKGFSERETPLFPTMMVQAQEEMGEGSKIPTNPHHTPTIIQPSTSQPQNKQKPRKPKRKDTKIPQSSVPSDNVADEAVNEEMDDSLVRVATTASSLEEEQDSGGGPRCQETIGDIIAQTRSENVSKLSNDLLLAKGNILRSSEDSLKLHELMALEQVVAAKDVNLSVDKVTLDQELAALKSAKDSAATTTTATIPTPTKRIVFQEPANIVSWDNVQAMIDVDYQMAQQMQAKEQEKIAQESSSKRAGTKLEQESIKKQKVDEDKETTKLQRLIEVVLDKEEVAIDVIPLATKPLRIVDYKIHKEGKKTYY
ncbi:hypothetical protein Tco_0929195 [Tanacetum coccineum]